MPEAHPFPDKEAPVVDTPPQDTPPADTPPADAPPKEGDSEFSTWLLNQPDELQNDASLQNIKSFTDLARTYTATKKMVGDRVALPGENTPPEEVNKFFGKLGMPETPDKYEFTEVEVPAGLGFDKAQLEEFRPIFHDLKLTQKQADSLQQKFLEKQSAIHNQLVDEYKSRQAEQIKVLKGRWGDSFEHNKDLAVRTFNSYANESLKATVEMEGWGNHPDFIELFYNLGMKTGEDSMIKGTPIEVRTLDGEIKAVEAELFKLTENDPKRRELLAKRNELYKQRYPQPGE